MDYSHKELTFTMMITVLVTVRVVSYTVTVRALVVPAVLALSVSVDVLNELGRARPQVIDTSGEVCLHVHVNDKPACTPNIPDDDDDILLSKIDKKEVNQSLCVLRRHIGLACLKRNI
jgi:hypothetical protein